MKLQIKHLLLLLLIMCTGNLYARLKGQARIDSLLAELPKAKEDTNKVKLLRNLSLGFVDSNPDEGLKYGQQELELATKLDWKKGIASANYDIGKNYKEGKHDYSKGIEYYAKSLKGFEDLGDKAGIASLLNAMGTVYMIKGDYSQSLECYQRGLKLYKELDNIRGVAAATCNIGNVYYSYGDYPKALEYYFKALKIDEANGYKQYTAFDVNNIANIYGKQGNYSKALEYYERGLKINEEIESKGGAATCTGNMGNIYREMKDYAKALEYFSKALKMDMETGDKPGIVKFTSNIGIVYKEQKKYAAAFEYLQSGLKLAEAIGEKEMIATDLYRIGDLYLEIIADTTLTTQVTRSSVNNSPDLLPNDYKATVTLPVGKKALLKGAFDHLQRGLAVAKEINNPEDMLDCYKSLAKAYELSGDYKKSLEMTANWHAIQDSIFSTENRNKIARMEDARKEYIDSLKAAEAQKTADAKAAHRRNYELIGGGVLLLALGFIFVLRKNNKVLDKEKKKSDNLLLNILPEEVAGQLKETGAAAARNFDDVTVLFTDFVNFTEASGRMKPEALIEELDTCFKKFDAITGKYGIEKIKTIGDAYLAVCGLPQPNPEHALNIVKAAQEITVYMQDREAKMGNSTFQIRIGIHSGSVVAGIVGVKKFAYDIWGDTVNTAARMEQNSEAGKINISQTTYDLVKDKINCEYRGEIDAKGKGQLKMYYVL
ncbi:MAG: hypothetical protein K0Q79_2137 [Flavipsychrobacter sp.]|jgi:class 3 adenylate cyclase/Tfp pilus assembly protein PilF|nr:hypothetical protein [Flavipsychrobacter sp.]